mmetsp:Transcript_10375/g.29967  ORF Transcript_10375/g.29967 Transcript_10375/m.29967 type:complete len:229 (+) Transcript_10375:141-827(+)
MSWLSTSVDEGALPLPCSSLAASPAAASRSLSTPDTSSTLSTSPFLPILVGRPWAVSRMKSAITSMVGFSNTSVCGSLTPVTSATELRNSTAPSESRPRSMSGASIGGFSADPDTCCASELSRPDRSTLLMALRSILPPPLSADAAMGISEKKAGMSPYRRRKVAHLRPWQPTTDGPRIPGARDCCRMTSPMTRRPSSLVMPRMPTLSRCCLSSAAMPCSIHGPHWML